jgi:hypothetical protein
MYNDVEIRQKTEQFFTPLPKWWAPVWVGALKPKGYNLQHPRHKIIDSASFFFLIFNSHKYNSRTKKGYCSPQKNNQPYVR